MKKSKAYTIAVVLGLIAILAGIACVLWCMYCAEYLQANPTALYVPIPGTDLSLPDNIPVSIDCAFSYMLFLVLFCCVYLLGVQQGCISSSEFNDRALYCSGVTFFASTYFYTHVELEERLLPAICSAIMLAYFAGRMFSADKDAFLDRRWVNLVSLLAACIAIGSMMKQAIPLSVLLLFLDILVLVFIGDAWNILVKPALGNKRSVA